MRRFDVFCIEVCTKRRLPASSDGVSSARPSVHITAGDERRRDPDLSCGAASARRGNGDGWLVVVPLLAVLAAWVGWGLVISALLGGDLTWRAFIVTTVFPAVLSLSALLLLALQSPVIARSKDEAATPKPDALRTPGMIGGSGSRSPKRLGGCRSPLSRRAAVL